MFSPQKLLAIMLLLLWTCSLLAQGASAQGQSQYEARLQAMKNARARAQQAAQPQSDGNVQQTAYQQGFDYENPPVPPADAVTRTARQPNVASGRVAGRQMTIQRSAAPLRVAARSRVAPNQYTPQHLRTAQIFDGQVVDDGAPIISGSQIIPDTPTNSDIPMMPSAPMISGAPVISGSACGGSCGGGCSSCGGGSYGPVYNEVVSEGVSDCGSCGTCGPCGLNFPCSERGGCPPGTLENCWIGQLGVILQNAEYFVGAAGFKGPSFTVPGTDNVQNSSDCNFGFYGGLNFGVPLCKLSCGLLSGQVGVRTVQSDFNGTTFTPETRDQLFVTGGLYRRVDYGLQAGVAYDWLQENWFTDTDLAQLRIDVGWVYPGGTTLGFRSFTNLEDDVTNGTINGVAFNGLTTTTLDNYRFYARRNGNWGGYCDLYAGWTDDNRTVLGLDSDLPQSDCIAIRSGLTYVFAGDTAGVGSTDSDSWNLYLGISFRPRGLSWYQNYDRPMFDVADNGSMMLLRQ